MGKKHFTEVSQQLFLNSNQRRQLYSDMDHAMYSPGLYGEWVQSKMQLQKKINVNHCKPLWFINGLLFYLSL